MGPSLEPNRPHPQVLAFCDYFSPLLQGGAERVSAEVFGRLAESGFGITVVSAVPGAGADSTDAHGIPTRVVPGIDLSRWVRSQMTIGPTLARVGQQAIDDLRPGVIHASGVHFHGSRVARRLALRNDLPLVTTVHVGALDALVGLTRHAGRAYERAFARAILRDSTAVIAVSEAVASHTRTLGADDVTVIPNGVDGERFVPGDRDESTFEVLFIGRLIGNKDPLTALKAFARLDLASKQLTFVGDGPLRKTLERRVRTLGLDEEVRFAGHVADVAPYLRQADVLVRPSLTEGQSLAILEAMASGVVVVASDIAANRELIRHGDNGLLHRVGDVDALSEHLASLSDDPEMGQQMTDRGLELARAHTWEAAADATAAVLRRAAEAKTT